MAVIKSWKGEIVRIKREYIKWTEEDWEEDEDTGESTLIYASKAYLECPLNGVVYNPVEGLFEVKSDCYGYDLYPNLTNPLDTEKAEPVHLLIIEQYNDTSNSISYPYMWDAKYFEIVRPVTIYAPIK